MKFLLISFLAVLAVAQASEIKWSDVKHFDITPPIFADLAKNSPGTKIVGGFEAAPNSIPYQAGLFISRPDGTYFCGGSLISQQYVMTAAHCVDAPSVVEARLGAHVIQALESTQVRIISSAIFVHEQWNPQTLENDIAVIQLSQPAPLSNVIQVVNLPTRTDASNDFAGDVGRISGWGRDSDTATSISPVLRYVYANIITNTACIASYGSYILNSHICTSGAGAVGSCSGDSGGPLVSNNKQVGIVSFGISLGCEVSWPSAFTRVTYFLDWIEQHTDVVIGN